MKQGEGDEKGMQAVHINQMLLGKVCTDNTNVLIMAFIGVVTLWDFLHGLKSKNHLVQYNNQYHRKVLINGFHWSGHTLGFLTWTQK